MAQRKMKYYPFALSLEKKRVVIAGAGAVAERKISSLLKAGADLHVIAPLASVKIKALAAAGRIKLENRKARESDLRTADIVIAATDDPDANRKISRWAKKSGVWVNVVDKPALSDFISTAILRKRKALVSVYTDGQDPCLSRDLKDFLKEHWDEFLCYRHRPQKR